MTELELEYLEWLNDICNTDYAESEAPAGFKIAIRNLVKETNSVGISSKSIQDMSITYLQGDDRMNSLVYSHIYPYQKMKW